MAAKKRGRRPVPQGEASRRLVGSSARARTPTAAARRTTSHKPAPEPAPAPRRHEERPWLDPQWLGPPPRARFSTGWALLPLRAFLGFTFVFAGLQKLANPGFFDASNPASIQAQLAGAALRSPIHPLISPLTHIAVPLGLLIAFGEVAVGLGTLLGLWARIAAVGGMVLSFVLFLTVSFHSSPYYTGSDIVFVFAWMPLVVVGAGGVLSADSILENRVRDQLGAEQTAIVPIPFSAARRACGFYDHGSCGARNGEPCAPAPCPWLVQRASEPRQLGRSEVGRRTVVVKGAAAAALTAAALVGGGLAAGLGRLLGGSTTTKTPTLGGTGSAPAPTTTSTSAGEPTTTSSAAVAGPTAPRPPGTRIGPAHDVTVGGAAAFQAPSSGDPALVVQPHSGTYLAFDAVCPHAGCTVEYDTAGKLFVCPCHGSEFNGITGGVEIGPAQSGLTRLTIAEGGDGQLYVV